MTLLDMQRAFSRLLTDPQFQHEFFAGSAEPSGYDLSERELASLRAMHRQRLAVHASNLAHARMGLALKSTPLSAILLHDQLDRYIARYCLEYPPLPATESAVIVATTRLCDFAEGLFGEGLLQPAYAWDLLRYEKLVLVQGFSVASCDSAVEFAGAPEPPEDIDRHWPVSGVHVAIEHFRYDLVPLVAALSAGEVPVDPQPLAEPVCIMFVKHALTALVQTVRLNRPTESVLRRCDGSHTVAEIAARYPLAARGSVVEVLRVLHRLGAVMLRDTVKPGGR